MKKILFTLIALLSFSFSQAQNGTIIVSGYAEMEVIPDKVKTSFSLEQIAASYENAVNQLNEQTKTLSRTLIRQGFEEEDIKTLYFNVRPYFEYKEGKRIDKGFRASQNLELVFNYEKTKLGDLIKSIASSDATPNFNISFFLSDDLRASMKEELLTAAVKDARKTGDILAIAAGSQISGFKEITYGVAQPLPAPRYQADMMMAKAESADFAGMEAKAIKLSEQVSIVWSVE